MILRIAALLLLAGTPALAQGPCATPPGAPGPSRDLYCILLYPGPAGAQAHGTAQLDWIPGPFTVSVRADGTHRWNVTLQLADLPPLPRGRAPGYMAWAADPSMASVTRLGTVREGGTRLAAVAFDRFLVFVSAEPDTSVRERKGALILRGESAGNRMRPADNYQFFLGVLNPASVGPGAAQAAEPMAAEHAHHHSALPDSAGWRDVPMYPGLTMLPSEMRLRPPTAAWLPPNAPDAPLARPRELKRLADGDTLDLTAGIVRRVIGGRELTMFGFNGQYPGPLLMVPQGASVTVRFRNALPMPTTVHWHGLRQDVRMDGVPDISQPAVEPGGAFTYTLRFPDGGIFWYHPHVREDIQQDLGLYGNIFVKPARPDAYGPVHREEFLILDDLLLDDQGLVPWGREEATHALTGRFGNVMLVNGEAGWRASVRRGEVVRLYLTNASNTRTFNLSLGPGVRLKVVGSDLGNFARQAWVESVVIAPAERYVVEARFDRAGTAALVNRVRAIDHLFARFLDEVDTLGVVTVKDAPATPDLAKAFATLRRDAGAAELDSLVAANYGKPPEHTLELRVTFKDLTFVSERLMMVDSAFFSPVEWAGTMPGMNWSTAARQARWTLHDPATGLDNMDVAWRFRQGDRVRVRLAGVRVVLHGMQHPIHIHGQRFLVLAVNGERNRNPVWKDTVLVPTGATVDLLVEVSNPGRWMVHCHIAEHLEAGMMTILDVESP